MFPWQGLFTSWGARVGFNIDALGLVTMLGATEIDASVGRLVPSRYVQFLPMIGAHVIAGDLFTEKKAGFTLYNIDGGFQTTELAGWLSRWLKAQNFHQIHSIVRWEVVQDPHRRAHMFAVSIPVGVCLTGMLVVLTVLSADWWGLANALSMAVSILVRWFLVHQNRLGIDGEIARCRPLSPADSGEEKKRDPVKVLVVMDDSKIITMFVPEALIGTVFAGNPKVPDPHWYTLARWAGWASFVIHVITMGMSALPTQIYSVVLLVVPTVLFTLKFGCDDSRIGKDWKRGFRNRGKQQCQVEEDENEKEMLCFISSTLCASCYGYPTRYEEYVREVKNPRAAAANGVASGNRNAVCPEMGPDPEANSRSNRRQDLYVWLEFTDEQEKSMKMWNLFPHDVKATSGWWDEYKGKRERFKAMKDARGGR